MLDKTTLASNQTEPVTERRHLCPSKHKLWSELNVVQQAAVSSMNNYGYELRFARIDNNNKQVVMMLNDSPIIIDEEGNIDTQANIKIRIE